MKETKSEPTPAIARILTLVRLLPADIELADTAVLHKSRLEEDSEGRLARIWEVFNVARGTENLSNSAVEKRQLFRDEVQRARNSYQREAFTDYLLHLPPDFIDYVALDSSIESNFHWALEFYGVSAEELGLTYDSLLQQFEKSPVERDAALYFAATARYEQVREFYGSIYELLVYLEHYKESAITMMFRKKPQFFSLTGVKVIENRLRFMPDEFTKAFNDIDIDRLGRCGYCRKVFWKRRIDMKGCTLLCAKSLRTRKWRENITPEKQVKYKINRIRKQVSKGE